MSSNSKEVEYIDLHTTGLGYLNRARMVAPDRGDPYLAVSISAIHGNVKKPNYTYYDCIVVGEAAYDFVKEHMETVNDRDHKVLVRFKVGDGVPDSYEVTKGDHKGKRRHVIKSRLLKISWAKIDDDVVLEPSETPEDKPTEQAISDDNNANVAVVTESGNTSADGNTSQSGSATPPVVKELPDTVKLSQDDPKFNAKKARLKELGYQWDNDAQVWRKSDIAA
ncbi:MAG: DUF3577 domain-containing protein [Gammaproteobacteria bacterium]|jgi:hypothetical protein